MAYIWHPSIHCWLPFRKWVVILSKFLLLCHMSSMVNHVSIWLSNFFKILKSLCLWHYVIVLVTLGHIYFTHLLFLLHLAMFINDNWYNCAFFAGTGRHHCINISINIWEAQVGLSKHLLFSSVDYKMISSLVHALLWSYICCYEYNTNDYFSIIIFFTYMRFGPMVLE